MSIQKITRRRFLSSSGRAVAAAATCTIVPRHVLGGPGRAPPSETITRGVVGTGGMGMNHVVPNKTLAVCDVDKNHLANGLKKAGEGCKGYSDFRRVLERKDIDTIHIPTPPHWHCLIAIAAAQAGKDIYSEKPISRFIHEGRLLIQAVKRYGRIYQANTAGRGGWRSLRKLVMSGLLGQPLTVRLMKRQGVNFKIKQWSGRTNLTPEPVPSALDYDMWLGPAPHKPYHHHRVHRSFRGYWDYDGGGLGDMGMHHIDPIQYVLGKDKEGPAEVEAYAPWPAHPDACGLWGRITFKWKDGTTLIIESGEWGEVEPGDPPFVEGPKGKVLTWRKTETDPPGLFDQLGRYPDPPRMINFETAVRTRNNENGVRPNAEEGQRSVTLVHLANIAIRTGRKLRWDSVQERFIGDDEANRFVSVPMRAPWHL